SIECPSASIMYLYENGMQVITTGHLTVYFNNFLKFTSFIFITTNYTANLPVHHQNLLSEYGILFKTLRYMEIEEGFNLMQNIMFDTVNYRHLGPLYTYDIDLSNEAKSERPNAFLNECDFQSNIINESPYWTVFWDIYSANLNHSGTVDIHSYVDQDQQSLDQQQRRLLNGDFRNYMKNNGIATSVNVSSCSDITPLPDIDFPIQAPNGFLYKWWTVFWDLYSASLNRPGTLEAKRYVK
ncbi:22421_t:CDS:2, partial [Dentiscutata erythropus]